MTRSRLLLASLAALAFASATYHHTVATVATIYHSARAFVVGFVGGAVETFKVAKLLTPERVALVQSRERATTMAKRKNIVMREGGWRLCPSV